MINMSMLNNECSEEEARSLLCACVLKQLEQTSEKDAQMYETALFRASALLIKFHGTISLSISTYTPFRHFLQDFTSGRRKSLHRLRIFRQKTLCGLIS